MNRITKSFTRSLLNWYAKHGRKDLPWQNPYIDYRVWLSEIMLQQTQVKTVIPYFLRFIVRYPDIHHLAHASLDDVLALWSGLGYYSRARNLHRTAQIIVSQYQGAFPQDLLQLQQLPGIGPSTAAAIASLAFEQPTAILDGNVKRVISRYFLCSGSDKVLWQQAQACMPKTQCRSYTQAIMDMGATCCTHKQPQCVRCPLSTHCQAFLQDVIQDYPLKKPQKVRPIRQEQFLLLHTPERLIYLEQRPAKGIWGGLWCMPNLDNDACARTHLMQHYGLDPQTITPLTSFKHSFTHFHLHITAYSIQTAYIASMPGQWVSEEKLETLGLAKPVKKIIACFFKAS
ncbi:MAG: A/G-specific adenine glycosylase [Gammaproteobacteria bacterium]|nr:A/G-specific adenine glycosylase [Gammaproteobacteria bacterium]